MHMVLRMSAGRMVGRDGELGRLLTLLDDAEAGRSVVALVSGDAGVGKSRLISEAVALAAGRGFTVLSGHCAELGDSVPYLPLADALRGAAQSSGVRDALSSRPALNRLLPEGRDGQQPDEDRSGLARQQMLGGVLGLLAELAAAAPVLLVLEDLHWADASTRDLVTFLSRMLHRERVALIGSYRSDDLHRRHPLRPLVAELQRLPSVITVDLAPLDPSALAEHLTATAPVRIDATVLNDIVARAEGNAYYAEELLAASLSVAASVGGGPHDRGSLPAGLAALLLSRVEQVSDAAQRVLRAAAVAGRKADDELVQAASGLEADEYEAAVREAVTHQLLVPDGTEGYVFRHALLREAVYGDLLPGERTRLHATMSALLADEHRLQMPGTAAELAQHCLASHDIPGAFAASVRAGEEAERLGAPAEAHRHYDHALALWERVADPEKTADMARGEARPEVRDQRGGQRRLRARRPPAPAAAAGARRPGGAGPGRRRPAGQQDRRAARLVPDAAGRLQGQGRGHRGGPGHGGCHPRRAADVAACPGDLHLRQHAADRERLHPGQGVGRAWTRRGPRRGRAVGRGRRAGDPRFHQQQGRPERRGHQGADPGPPAGAGGEEPRGGAAGRVLPGAGAPRAGRPDHRRGGSARGHPAGQPDRAQHGAVRP